MVHLNVDRGHLGGDGVMDGFHFLLCSDLNFKKIFATLNMLCRHTLCAALLSEGTKAAYKNFSQI